MSTTINPDVDENKTLLPRLTKKIRMKKWSKVPKIPTTPYLTNLYENIELMCNKSIILLLRWMTFHIIHCIFLNNIA